MGLYSILLIPVNYLAPCALLLITFALGLLTSLWHMCRNPRQVLWVHQWRTSFLGATQPMLFALSDRMLKRVKQDLLKHAAGIVLEVGGGRGHSLKYYDRTKIQRIWVVEPDETSVLALKREIHRLDMDSICGVLKCRIEDADVIHNGIATESIDTVVCIQTLCTVPNPRLAISFLYSLLKPGSGQLIFLEHVASTHVLTRAVQDIYTRGIWRFVMGGCELNRDTAKWCVDGGGTSRRYEVWSGVEIDAIPGDWTNIFPHVKGILVKSLGPA
ncbi:class I SAM-dependent methyltransferase [Aspergillus lucknowensis]|uniref:S-adenosyl-L-methionine-dependent methyltransferase n=1 Tax=Aspergillus lucknowensis TaxID=176173 RepID=A0ABR4LWV5_9EURO